MAIMQSCNSWPSANTWPAINENKANGRNININGVSMAIQ
jgi:hypothetical protein